MKISNLMSLIIGLTMLAGMYNACGKPVTDQASSRASTQCLPVLQFDRNNLKASKSTSPFSNGKMILNLEALKTRQKLNSGVVEVMAVMNNSCLLNLEKTDLKGDRISLKIKGDTPIHSELKNQAYKYELNTNENLDLLSRNLEEDSCVIGMSHLVNYHSTGQMAQYVSDPLAYEQKHLDYLNLGPAFNLFHGQETGVQNLGANKIVVAVVDSGVDFTHPDLEDQMWKDSLGHVGVNVLELGNGALEHIPYDVSLMSHGTHVAGIIGAEANSIGVLGLATFGVKIMAVRTFESGAGVNDPLVANNFDIFNGISWAISKGADIINLSIAIIPESNDYEDPFVSQALLSAVENGIFVATGAGNGNSAVPSQEIGPTKINVYPALYGSGLDGLITVGSIDTQTGNRSTFSHWSSEYVEIGAPGAEDGEFLGIMSLAVPGTLSNGYQRLWGTSMSSPMVASAGALVKGLVRQATGQDPTAAEIEKLILASARVNPSLNNYFKNGKVLDFHRLGVLVHKVYNIPTVELLPDFCEN